MCIPKRCINSPSLKITEQKGFGRRPTCAMRIPRKFLIIQATRTNLSKPSAKIGSLTATTISPAEALTMYADGWITGVGTLFPAETVHVYDLCKAGKPLEARDYIMTVCRKYMHFFNEPTQEGLPSPWLAIIKEGLTMRGIPIGLPRRPIHPLPDSVRAELTAVMRAFGYYKLG